MKKLSLTTAIYFSTTAMALAAGNSLTIVQAPVGTGVPAVNFTQDPSSTDEFAFVQQTGSNSTVGTQTGKGTKVAIVQQNPTGGPANNIGYSGTGYSDVKIYQRSTDGLFTASGASGNTAVVSVAENIPGNQLFVDQVGFNNSAIIRNNANSIALTPTLTNSFNVAQFSDNVAAGNQLQVVSSGVVSNNGQFVQRGGNKADVAINGGVQSINLQQNNTADNIASANVAHMTINGAVVEWSQHGTRNDLEANLAGNTVNAGLYGWQEGDNNLGTVTQTNAYLDAATGANKLYQTGNDNIALATQTNTHNSQFIIQQNGNANNVTVNQTGTDHLANVYQNGNANVASVVQTGAGATLHLSQY